MAGSPFLASANTNTTTQGSIWTVLVQPSFADLAFEAAALVTKGAAYQAAAAAGVPKTAHYPGEFALRIEEAAQVAVGREDATDEKGEGDEAEAGANNEEGVETKELETEEIREAKRKVVEEIWTKVQPSCFTRTDDRELEATINLLLSLLLMFFQPSHPKFTPYSLQLLESIVTAEGKTTSYGRYSTLFTLFNSLPVATSPSESRPPLQLIILSRLADMASAHPEDLSILLPSLLRLPSYLTEWNLVSSKIAVNTIEKVMRACQLGGKHQDALNMGIVYLSCPGLTQETISPEFGLVSELCLRLGLSLPDFYEWDLLEGIPLISKYLNSTPEGQERYKKLIGLLMCPTTKFQEVEEELLSNAQLGKVIDEEAKQRIQRKVKLLNLAELCANRVGGEVKYEEVKECLRLSTPIEEDDGMEVEEWVINAVKAKLITARLHQPTHVVFVTRSTCRSFGSNQWQLLQTRLKAWGSSIDHLIQVVEQSLATLDSQRRGPPSGNDENSKGKYLTAMA